MEPQPPPPATVTKIRLMCSYGGRILPRPQTKSLHYLGGDTRIISVPTPTATATIADFITHVSAALHQPCPFSLKYQLPLHDMDSLISLSTDEDLQIMIEEHQRLSSNNNSNNNQYHSHSSSRIRLFLFLVKQQTDKGVEESLNYAEEEPSSGLSAVLQHPNTEAWFVDALKSARMMEEAQNDGEVLGGGGLQESMVLETSSSFGSTSSSVSLSNSAAAKAGNSEENVGCLQESKVQLRSADSVAR